MDWNVVSALAAAASAFMAAMAALLSWLTIRTQRKASLTQFIFEWNKEYGSRRMYDALRDLRSFKDELNDPAWANTYAKMFYARDSNITVHHDNYRYVRAFFETIADVIRLGAMTNREALNVLSNRQRDAMRSLIIPITSALDRNKPGFRNKAFDHLARLLSQKR